MGIPSLKVYQSGKSFSSSFRAMKGTKSSHTYKYLFLWSLLRLHLPTVLQVVLTFVMPFVTFLILRNMTSKQKTPLCAIHRKSTTRDGNGCFLYIEMVRNDKLKNGLHYMNVKSLAILDCKDRATCFQALLTLSSLLLRLVMVVSRQKANYEGVEVMERGRLKFLSFLGQFVMVLYFWKT